MTTLSKNLTRYRKEARLTQEEVAEKLDVVQTVIARYECGNRKPSAERRVEITLSSL
jgi:transcriptional regulator with XRE-family HTH domain